jgi:hypothetical protein
LNPGFTAVRRMPEGVGRGQETGPSKSDWPQRKRPAQHRLFTVVRHVQGK